MEERDYQRAFIKTVQYISSLTMQQDLYTEIERAMLNFFGANLVAFASYSHDGQVECKSWSSASRLELDEFFGSESMEHVSDVFETAFLLTDELQIKGEEFLLAYLPLKQVSKVTSVLIIGHADIDTFSKELLEIYIAVAGIVGTIEVAKISAEKTKELEVAKHIQSSLVPKLGEKNLEGFEISGNMETMDEVGGDYYDIIRKNSGDIWFVIGDVSGHGLTAGLIMIMVQTAIHTILQHDSDLIEHPDKLLSIVNKAIYHNLQLLDIPYFVTMTIVMTRDRELFYFSGLHQDMLIYRRETDRVEALRTEGVWVGIVRDYEFQERLSFRLDEGDVLLLFTDGITEAKNKREPNDLFGQDYLSSLLKTSAKHSTETIKSEILKALSSYHSNDDTTFLIIKKTE